MNKESQKNGHNQGRAQAKPAAKPMRILNPATKQPVSNPALNEAAKALRAENNAQNLNVVINALTRAVLIAPARVDMSEAPQPDANGRIAVPKNTRINFSLIKTKDGKSYFPAFSNEEELRKWKQGPIHQVMVLRFDDYARMLEQNSAVSGFVVDPFGDNLRFESKMVASIKQQHDAAVARAQAGLRQTKVKPGDKITIVEPSVYPDQLLDPLCEALADNQKVAAAYLQVMLVNDTDRYYLLVLDAPRDDQMLLAVSKALRGYMTSPDRKMEINITTSDTPLGQQGMRDSEPFYVRGKGRIDNLDDEDDSQS